MYKTDYVPAIQSVIFTEMMIIIPQVHLGAGRHWQYIEPPENIVKGLHLNFVTQPLCLIGLCLTKVSVGLFLLRITPSKRFQYFIWGCIVFTVLSSTGNLRKFDVRSGPSFKLTDTVTSHGHASVQAPCFYLGCFRSRRQVYPSCPPEIRSILQL